MKNAEIPLKRFLTCAAAVIFVLATTIHAAKPPLFELKDLDGQTFKLESELGKSVIIIDFWATWCKPCLRELPHINELYQKLKDKGLKVYAISIDDTSSSSSIKPTVKKYGFAMPILLDTDNTVIRKYNASRNVPYLMIIGKDGDVLREFTGYKPGDEALVEEIVTKQLNKASAVNSASPASEPQAKPPEGDR
jgi:cytochrome c biogenesis protein CcmG, thiol:disulfide interchange protein DsbE